VGRDPDRHRPGRSHPPPADPGEPSRTEDGYELGETVHRRWPGIKILYSTGYADRLAPRVGEARGPMLLKPYNETMLVETVQTALQGFAL
jgi:hypothetical protein